MYGQKNITERLNANDTCYYAPELIRSLKGFKLDHVLDLEKCDIWSLGVV